MRYQTRFELHDQWPIDTFKRLRKHADPLPLTPGEFAVHAEIKKRFVEQLIAHGEIEMVTTNREERIPFSAFQSFMTANVRDKLECVRAIFVFYAVALETGIVVRRGVDDRGCVVYERTEEPLVAKQTRRRRMTGVT